MKLDRSVPTFAASRLAIGLVFGLVTLLAVSAGAQVPSDSVLRDFEPTGDYLLFVGGQEQPKAKVYQSKRAAAFLIRAAAFESPLLLSPRTGGVDAVPILSLDLKANGSVDVLADAELSSLGRFRLDGEEVVWSVGGKEARLKPKPPLTGLRKAPEMVEHSPDYQMKADAYTPDPAAVAKLKGRTDMVRVRVFFGSWCPFCKTSVPRLLKVEEQLKGSKVQIEYYGLPKPPFDQEPEAKAAGISGVPTGIVYVGGKEVGRLSGEQWEHPEQSLQKLLGG